MMLMGEIDAVILSEDWAEQSEAQPQSKDPYLDHSAASFVTDH